MISTFTVLIDANVLFGARIRSYLLELASSGLFRARWSDDIHREWMTAVLAKRPDIERAKLDRVRAQMDAAVPDCLVTGYEGLVSILELPDANDRHVLAAAIVGRASCIVTFNEPDFPDAVIRSFGIHTRHPDRFLLDLEGLESGTLVDAARVDRAHYRNPPLSVEDYITGLRRAGLGETAEHLNRLRVLLEE